MEQAIDIKKYPPWKQAVDKILEKFEREGYGCLISDDEFVEFLSIEPKEIKTLQDFKQYNLDLLQRYAAIDSLLCNYDLCLIRSPGNKGFEILPPKEQITRGYDKRMGKLRKEINNLQKVLTNVHHEMLSLEEEKERQTKLIKTAFIKTASNKRKFEIDHKQQLKLLRGNQ